MGGRERRLGETSDESQVTRPAATDRIRLRRAYGATRLYGTDGTYM